jgi:energy-coupling factor transport system permease protein
MLKKSFKYYFFIAVTIAIINPLVSHRGTNILFYLFDNPITAEACVYGLISGLGVINVFLIFMSFNLVFSYHELLYLFSKIVPSFTMIITMCLRFIPTLKYRLKDLMNIQKCRGIDLSRGNLLDKIKKGIKLLDSLIVISLEEAMQTADSIRARGYGVAKRTSYLEYTFSVMDYSIIAINIILFLIIFAGFNIGFGNYQTYPMIQRIEIDFYYLSIFIIQLLLPFIIEKERIFKHAISRI